MDESENYLPKGAAFDADYYLRTDDIEEALEAAPEMAEAAGLPFCVVFDDKSAVFTVGPVDEVDVLAEGEDRLVIAAFDEDGESSPIVESMFSDDTADDDFRARLSHPARAARDALRPEANEDRAARSATARCWRRENLDLTEMEVKHRSLFTRRTALTKKKTTKDKDRRRVARNAKNWRLRNKSRAKRYGSLYHGPRTKVKEAVLDAGPEWHDVVVDPETGEFLREATETEVSDAIAAGGTLIVERRRRRKSGSSGVPQQTGNHTEPHTPVLGSDSDLGGAGGL